MRQELETLFNQEVENIRKNPLLPYNWGYYQDYLREHFALPGSTYSIHFKDLPGDAVAEVGLFAKDGKAYVRIRMPKVECVRSIPCTQPKYEDYELDILTKELPDDLQELLMKPTATAVQPKED